MNGNARARVSSTVEMENMLENLFMESTRERERENYTVADKQTVAIKLCNCYHRHHRHEHGTSSSLFAKWKYDARREGRGRMREEKTGSLFLVFTLWGKTFICSCVCVCEHIYV